MPYTLWLDADALPKLVKEAVIKHVLRRNINCYFVANQYINIPNNQLFKSIVVENLPDAADLYIIDHLQVNDVVVTADIPLAAKVIELQAISINPRGKIYNKSNINSILAMRNLMTDLRNDGIIQGGPSSYSSKDLITFNNSLDKILQSIK